MFVHTFIPTYIHTYTYHIQIHINKSAVTLTEAVMLCSVVCELKSGPMGMRMSKNMEAVCRLKTRSVWRSEWWNPPTKRGRVHAPATMLFDRPSRRQRSNVSRVCSRICIYVFAYVSLFMFRHTRCGQSCLSFGF